MLQIYAAVEIICKPVNKQETHTQRMKSLTVSGNWATICSRRGNSSRASRLPNFIASVRDVMMTRGNSDSDGQSTFSAVSENTQTHLPLLIYSFYFTKLVVKEKKKKIQTHTERYTVHYTYKYTNTKIRIPRWSQLDCMTWQIYYFIN